MQKLGVAGSPDALGSEPAAIPDDLVHGKYILNPSDGL